MEARQRIVPIGQCVTLSPFSNYALSLHNFCEVSLNFIQYQVRCPWHRDICVNNKIFFNEKRLFWKIRYLVAMVITA